MFIARDALQTARNTISQHVSAAFQFYEKHTNTLDIVCCVTRSATRPSISDMLEWLQDADRHYRLQYPLKTFSFSRLSLCITFTNPTMSEMYVAFMYQHKAFLSFTLRLLQRRNFMEMLTPTDLALMETAPKRWESLRSPSREERIAGISSVFCIG